MIVYAIFRSTGRPGGATTARKTFASGWISRYRQCPRMIQALLALLLLPLLLTKAGEV